MAICLLSPHTGGNAGFEVTVRYLEMIETAKFFTILAQIIILCAQITFLPAQIILLPAQIIMSPE